MIITRTSASDENRKSVPTHIILYDGDNVYTVHATLYTAVRLQVEEVIPALLPGEKYTLEILCGESFWDQLTDGEKRMAGRCMAQMVVKGLLPLRFAETKHEYPKQYQLL